MIYEVGRNAGSILKLGDGTSSLALSLYPSLCVHVCEREKFRSSSFQLSGQ